jgi:hypothetical protein
MVIRATASRACSFLDYDFTATLGLWHFTVCLGLNSNSNSPNGRTFMNLWSPAILFTVSIFCDAGLGDCKSVTVETICIQDAMPVLVRHISTAVHLVEVQRHHETSTSQYALPHA